MNTDKHNEKQIPVMSPIDTPLGQMIAVATDQGICMLEFADYKLIALELRQLSQQFKAPLIEGDHPLFHTLRLQLEEYFNGTRKAFDIPLDLVGTPFQKSVWRSLLLIPYATTTTYGKQAARIGKLSSVRAVANANGKNKISLLLPCHRVIGADGSLTGYGGGLWRKEKLLALERENSGR